MLTIDAMKDFGCNTAEALGRCMNNEQFYFRLLKMSVNDQNFDKLRDAVNAHDLKASFEAAHALKGSLGNLALTPLFNVASEMTELLRSGTDMDYKPMLDKLLGLRDQLKAIVEG